MAGRRSIVRSIQSYINRSDARCGLGPLKAGNGPSIGRTQWTWQPLQKECNKGPNDFNNSPLYYSTLQWQRYGNLRPAFVPCPKQAYINFPPSRYPLGVTPNVFSGNFNQY
jgi:hypothetical protein